MRLPGFFHRKGEPSLVRIVKANGSAPHKASEFPTAKEGPHRSREGDPTANGDEPIPDFADIHADFVAKLIGPDTQQ